MQNGKVLAVGGDTGPTELYDPASGTWSAAESLTIGISGQTANLLPDGTVIVAGGYWFPNAITNSEIYNPVKGNWSKTDSLIDRRTQHTATLLSNGKVLAAGGLEPESGTIPTAELYDPASRTWTYTGDLVDRRYSHTTTLLPNGKVLVAGGFAFNGDRGFALETAELYDPATGMWSLTGNLPITAYSHSAALLPNGKVLVVGGFNTTYLPNAELYDPTTGTWTATASLPAPVAGNTETLLPDGEILVARGVNTAGAMAAAELYDPQNETWTATSSLAVAREAHTATLLLNGNILVTGGEDSNFSPLASAEIYDTGLGFSSASQPKITTPPSKLASGRPLRLAGMRF